MIRQNWLYTETNRDDRQPHRRAVGLVHSNTTDCSLDSVYLLVSSSDLPRFPPNGLGHAILTVCTGFHDRGLSSPGHGG